MVTSLISGVGVLNAVAAAGPSARAGAEPTKDIVTGSRVADPNTMDDYLNRLLTAENGSRYAGRVWTDKTVFAYSADLKNLATGGVANNQITLDMATDGYNGNVGFNSDFAHVYSVLASSQVVNEYPPSPVDLVIVFDMSGSMGQDTRYSIDTGKNAYVEHDPTGDDSENKWPAVGVPMADRIAHSRIQATLDAINSTIDKLMEQNPQNRVAVCGYGANAVVLMPLGHYKRVDADHDGKGDPYLSVGGMETLYHPSDLVYREPRDIVNKNGTPLAEVKEAGWYWMNNRDTCYTVVVNAEYNTYTGVLNDDTGDGTSRTDASGTDFWTEFTKTVSNNVLSDDGKQVKAFPGEWDANGDPTARYADLSKEVYQGSSSDVNTWAGGATNYPTLTLRTAMAKGEASGLEADDYVGYFTNTQGGIYLAYKQLADSTATTYTEELTNGVISTVARIPAAIIMSDGGANFSFNEMGSNKNSYSTDDYTVEDWNGRYGQRLNKYVQSAGLTDYIQKVSATIANTDSCPDANYYNYYLKGRPRDLMHLTGDHDGIDGNTGDEWYKVFLPGDDTLGHASDDDKWNGLHGIYNQGADIFEDGTLSSQPSWVNAGVLYSSDNSPVDAPGTVLEVLLTAAYMHDVVKTHYSNGWTLDGATEDSKSDLFTYTMNVDTQHVPQWGKMRLYPTLDPKDYSLDKIDSDKWYTKEETFGSNELGNDKTLEGVYTELYNAWTEWKTSGETTASIWTSDKAKITLKSIANDDTADASYTTSILTKDGRTQADTIHVTDENVVDNIAYNDGFYDVTSGALDETFAAILSLILGNVFVPVSGDNDAGVGDSITYQDPLGEYMEIKDGAITATPHHVDDPTVGATGPQDYDMALLVFGEMHGLVRVGVYDWQWNDTYMREHSTEGTPGTTAFPMGWYYGNDPKTAEPATAENTTHDDAGTFPKHAIGDENKTYANANEARADGWVFRVNYSTLLQFVPITGVDTTGTGVHPSDLPAQVKNTKYTLYRFAGSTDDRNALHRNPIYGEGLPKELADLWAKYEAEGSYPVGDSDYADTPGVYRLSDIRVWVEDTGDFVDTTGAIAPNQGYDRSLYMNVPAAAVPTELATITMGKDGVLSYETNLGSDHKVGSYYGYESDGKKEHQVTEDEYSSFCYQSTPLRLFYAVGLEDDLILRGASGEQVGVDLNAISPEYIQAHTGTDDHVWFISNYYSGTRYGGYTTDDTSRTRGDPTVTFSPSSDNRYYVFQKPLPLYAHAYRITEEGDKATGHAVDNNDGHIWSSGTYSSTGNGNTVWEDTADGTTGGANWKGGQFMGVYTNSKEFQTAYSNYKASGKSTITDSHGNIYEFVDGGIIFSEEDILDHVTSAEGGGVEPGSKSFSSDDYYFILLEFYLPDEGTGVDDQNKEVPGTSKGHMVQYAIARKGSEFGSGYNSEKIRNGDMLCWTDTNNKLNVELDYASMSDTGDRTRGEPTWQKLTYTDTTLRDYLAGLGLDNEHQVPNPDFNSAEPADPDTNPETIGALTQQVNYWTKVQEDPLVQAALNAADENDDDTLSEDEFKDAFDFALATRPGGVRSGDMSNNLQYKGDTYNDKTGYYSGNNTETSNTYYLPTISDNSGTDDEVIINNFLGNNGRLEISNETLHVTKMLAPPDGYALTEGQETEEEFNFQVSIQGVTGTRSAVKTEYNPYVTNTDSETGETTTGAWERELAYIDVLTDNSDLVQTNESTRAIFVKEKTPSTLEGSPEIDIAKQVILNEGKYYYADENGALPTAEDGTSPDSAKEVPTESINNGLYYLYLPSNGKDESSQHVHRLYQNKDYEGTDAGDFKLAESKNGTTTFVNEGQHAITPSESGEANRDSYRVTNDPVLRPSGTKTYWVQDAELIPKDEVDAAEANSIASSDPGSTSAIATIALEAENGGGTWTHDEAQHWEHEELTFHTFVIRKPGEALDSKTNFTSPYKTRTQYMTVELNFGYNANENDGSTNTTERLTEADLYDKTAFGSLVSLPKATPHKDSANSR